MSSTQDEDELCVLLGSARHLSDEEIIRALRSRSCRGGSLRAEVFTYGERRLVIAYPEPPRRDRGVAGIRLMRRK